MARILVIEDNADLRTLWMLALTTGGHEVRGVEDGREGLRVYECFQPSLVLTDLNLPEGMQGLEVVKKLRGERGVTTIAVSGSRTALEAARQLGVRALQKPVDMELLLQIANQ